MTNDRSFLARFYFINKNTILPFYGAAKGNYGLSNFSTVLHAIRSYANRHQNRIKSTNKKAYDFGIVSPPFSETFLGFDSVNCVTLVGKKVINPFVSSFHLFFRQCLQQMWKMAARIKGGSLLWKYLGFVEINFSLLYSVHWLCDWLYDKINKK